MGEANPAMGPIEYVGLAHEILGAAASSLQALGLDSKSSAQLMLGYSATWLQNSAGTTAAAEQLYRSADVVAVSQAEGRR